ncbi:5-carboxymethyl-2-hydroxymuconate Delta-isomerase [Aliiroseovarius crassostreae]|uniref:5-carboxymethyl-2-hydroxymuconate Delta-isomerase n=1 Tax=Aliiroseovarius crassostreae TaxID=154981 RepID=UPI002205289F|nr:5-carboxymethyl-2-hydroxymuconate Delta-isomerase [Aliiroseovarius crassostreae]UWP93077.1 5-carboxymethyl-2-hydroxymuconate Delta-isomerase [Aliiroseovarius crassostreae]
MSHLTFENSPELGKVANHGALAKRLCDALPVPGKHLSGGVRCTGIGANGRPITEDAELCHVLNRRLRQGPGRDDAMREGVVDCSYAAVKTALTPQPGDAPVSFSLPVQGIETRMSRTGWPPIPRALRERTN